jgi:hypothetical protein
MNTLPFHVPVLLEVFHGEDHEGKIVCLVEKMTLQDEGDRFHVRVIATDGNVFGFPNTDSPMGTINPVHVKTWSLVDKKDLPLCLHWLRWPLYEELLKT